MCAINEVIALIFATAILIFSIDSGLQLSEQRRTFITANIIVIITSAISILIIILGQLFDPLPLLLTRILIATINICGVMVAAAFSDYAFRILIDHDKAYRQYKKLTWIIFGYIAALIVIYVMTTDTITVHTLGRRPDPYITIAPLSVLLYAVIVSLTALFNKTLAIKKFISIILVVMIVSIMAIIVQIIFSDVMLNGITSVFVLMVVSFYLQNKKALLDNLLEIQNRSAFIHNIAGKKLHLKGSHLYLIEVSDYKSYLETHGNEFASAILLAITNRLIAAFDRNKLYRYTSDIFAIHITQETKLLDTEIEAILCPILKEPLTIKDIKVSLDFRIFAVSLSMIHGDDLMALIEYARTTLSKVRDISLHRLDQSIINQYRREKAIATTLATILDTKEIDVVFQPIYDVKNGQFTKAEVLARLTDPEYGEIAPLEFIQIAERSSLINKLGSSVIRQSGAMIKTLMAKDSTISALAINLSALQIADINLADEILNTFKLCAIPYDSLSFEVTETVFVRNNSHLLRLATALRPFGIKLALDDFGTGYANIESVFSGIFDTIKFDGTLFRDMVKDKKGTNVIRNMIGLFKSLGIRTTIEGIENERHEEEAVQSGAEELQGFHLARPITAEQLLIFKDR